jgi:hypothetical protein
MNLSAALSPNFDLSFNTGFVKTDNRLPQSDNNIFSLYGDAQENYGFRQRGLDQTPGGLGADQGVQQGLQSPPLRRIGECQAAHAFAVHRAGRVDERPAG